MGKKTRRLPAVFFSLFGLLLLTAMGPSGQTPSKGTVSPFEIEALVNSKAPDFVLRDLSGKEVSLTSLKGKVVLINFWATWCPPCKHEMPSFNKLYQEMRGKGLEILAISTDSSINLVHEYAKKNHFDFTILFDEGRKVTKQYKVFSMPTTFLVDRNGIIVEKFLGEYDWASPDIKKKIEKL